MIQHHISLCFFSERALQQSGQQEKGGGEKHGAQNRKTDIKRQIKSVSDAHTEELRVKEQILICKIFGE